MLDDDIQYLGTRLKPREPPRFPQRSVAGATLHIEKSDGNGAYALTFERDKSSTIHVGRRPGSEIESRTLDQERGRAMFRCAVVSRRHAKIAFSDSGHAYLIDLHSHHGTHIRKPGETSSRMLEPEVPTSLSDGDIITFGKSVGRNEEMVRPVVARVQLIYNAPLTCTIKPLVVPETTLVTPKSTSGRYGLHSPSSSSSDDAYNGQLDSYSDIEEIPPASTALVPFSQADSQPKHESHFGRAFEVLKRLLPPASISLTPPHLDPDLPIIESSNSAQSNAASSSSSSPSELPPLWSISNNCSPLSLFPRYPPLSNIDLSDNFFSLPPINPSQSSDASSSPNDEDNRSGSESPMDLASPSPPPAEPLEPLVIDAWSKFIPNPDSEADPTSADKLPTPDLVSEPPAETRESHEAGEDAAVNTTSYPVTTNDKEREEEKALDPDIYVTTADLEDLKMKHARLQASMTFPCPVSYPINNFPSYQQEEVNHLQNQRRKYKYKFNANVHTVMDKFSELEDRVNDVNAQCTLFMDQIENITNMDVPDLQAQINELEDQQELERAEAEDLKRRVAEWEDKAKAGEYGQRPGDNPIGDEGMQIQEYSKAFKGLVDDMKMSRTKIEQEIRAELESIRQLRQSILNEPTVPSSLKRKRSTEAEDERDGETGDDHEGSSFLTDAGGDALMSTDIYLSQSGSCMSDRPSPRKRARRIASIMAHTAAIAAAGGATAWALLAFL